MARPKSRKMIVKDALDSLRKSDRNRSRGSSHGKAISRGLKCKVLEDRLNDIEKQLDRTLKEAEHLPALKSLVSCYDDVVEALARLIPNDLNKTHGPTRRTIMARAKHLFHEAEKLGVALHVD